MTAKSLLAAAIAALLLSATVADVQAQGVSRETRPAQDGSSEEDEGSRKKKKDDKADEGPTFPNATREDPGKGKSKLQSKLMKMQNAFASDKFDEVIAMAEEVFADPKASAYDKSQAAYFASFASVNTDNNAQAIVYGKRALDENGLENSIHFQLMQNIAQMHLVEEQYAEALAVADRFVAETQMPDDAKVQMLRGNALYRLDRFPEAIEALKKVTAAPDAPKGAMEMLMDSYLQADRMPEAVAMAEANAAKFPQDKRVQLNLANIYAMAEQPEKAAAVFARLQAGGLLTDEKDYELGYKLLSNLEGRERDTIAFINSGLEKGILKPNAQLYAVLGQSYYFSEQIPQAIEAWGKGAPLAKDGEMFLNLGKVNSQEEQWAAAKAAAQQALAKGVKKPGEAWIVIAGADLSMGNKAGAIAGYREAAKHASSRDEANRMLKSLGQ